MWHGAGCCNWAPAGQAPPCPRLCCNAGLPIDDGLIESRHWVADVVYFPLETELIRRARARGCRVLPGGGMAVYQAVRAFALFTGREPDAGAMAMTFSAAVKA